METSNSVLGPRGSLAEPLASHSGALRRLRPSVLATLSFCNCIRTPKAPRIRQSTSAPSCVRGSELTVGPCVLRKPTPALQRLALPDTVHGSSL